MSVILVDLDDFKVVNDALGHAAGDDLLVTVAERLRASVRTADTVARLGGDEFAILLEGVVDVAVERVLRTIIGELRRPVRVEGRELGVRASFGVVGGKPGDDAGDLLRRADIAMYEAKARGDGGWQHYVPGMEARGVELDRAAGELRQALDHGDLRLYYQPVVALPGGELVGVEALVRWQHPQRGLVGPADFIPVAEQTSMIVELGHWVPHEACRQQVAWHLAHPVTAPRTVSVNVSARQLQEASFADEVVATLRDTGLSPCHLTVEITESTAVGGGSTAHSLARLRELGGPMPAAELGALLAPAQVRETV